MSEPWEAVEYFDRETRIRPTAPRVDLPDWVEGTLVAIIVAIAIAIVVVSVLVGTSAR